MATMVTATLTHTPKLHELSVRLIERIRPKRPRSLREFAEQEVVIPTGEHKDCPFRIERQPFTGVLFDEIDSDSWPTVVITGPSQSSKSLCGFSIPALRTICEYGENAGLACPEADLHAKRWKIDLQPVLEASPRLRRFIPQAGSGSRRGDVKDKIEFSHGPQMLLFTRGGKDTNKAAVTLRWMFVTEAAGWSGKSETSKEGGLIAQLRARLRGFGIDRQRFIIEGTVTDEEDYPWRLRGSDDDDVPISTRSKLVVPCPHCDAWIAPERPQLKGWQQSRTDREAADLAYWECPTCEGRITEEQRKSANQNIRILHHGQTIDKRGVIRGEVPNVFTLWFRWTQFNNLLVPVGNIAVDEWLAAQKERGSQEHDDAERELCQFGHCIPFRSTLAESEPLNPKIVSRRRSEWPRNVLPPDTTHVVAAVDPGKWTAWWIVLAARANGVIYVPAYGNFNPCASEEDDVESHLRASLHQIIDDTFEVGFDQAGKVALRAVDSAWFDRGWMKDQVCDVVRAYGNLRDNRYKAAKGFGQTSKRIGKAGSVGVGYRHPEKRTEKIIHIGTRWHAKIDVQDKLLKFNFDADYWKLWVQERLRVEKGCKGSLEFFRADSANEHTQFAHHLCSEQLETTWEPLKGLVKKWVKRGRNHWLDCAAMAAAALDYKGFKLSDIPDPEPSEDDNWYARMRGAE